AGRGVSGHTERAGVDEPGASALAAKDGPRRPLLGDMLMSLLEEHSGPLPAKEVRDELLARHPERNPTPQVVRNTLESLVAKGRIQRHKHERSVTYTVGTRGQNHAAVADGS
ncbi:BlaI/MecI/CopY family transcriptional regulator, partial [Streptomyces fagopyri]